MGFQGMDVPQARKLAGHLRDGAAKVDGMVGRIATMLAGVTWVGEDGRRFHEDWTTEFGPRLRAATGEVSERATELHRRADAQEAASGA